MKKSDGIVPPTLVLAEEGQKGDFGPPPSSCMEVGTFKVGLRITALYVGHMRLPASFKAGTPIASAKPVASAMRSVGVERQRSTSTIVRPTIDRAMCAHSSGRFVDSAPKYASARPVSKLAAAHSRTFWNATAINATPSTRCMMTLPM